MHQCFLKKKLSLHLSLNDIYGNNIFQLNHTGQAKKQLLLRQFDTEKIKRASKSKLSQNKWKSKFTQMITVLK